MLSSVVAAVVLHSAAAAASSWNHGWASTSQMTFADFNPSHVLTDVETTFAADKYRVLSFEKCSGIQAGIKTEDAIYTMAQNIKKKDPTIKVMFYWATDQQGINCYNAGATFASHPEWWLKYDNGTVIANHGSHFLDTTNAQAREWWMSVPLSGQNGTGKFNGVPVTELIDGVLADSGGYERYGSGLVSIPRLEALEDAKFNMMGGLQDQFTKANGGMVMANGISMYGGVNEDPRYPNDDNIRVLNYTGAIMNEHTAVFECINAKNASFNVDTTATDLTRIEQAAAVADGSKMVFVQTWPGMYVGTGFYPTKTDPASVYPPVANGGEPTPQNNSQWRDALREHFGFAHALFLSIATENMYWMYGGFWYRGNTGYIACPQDLNSCPAPPEWYPDLDKPLGAPLGQRTLVSPYVWTRKFEHAIVTLDLNNPKQSKVAFDGDK